MYTVVLCSCSDYTITGLPAYVLLGSVALAALSIGAFALAAAWELIHGS